MRILLAIAIVLAAVLPSHAEPPRYTRKPQPQASHAEPPRYTRKPQLQIDVKVSDRARPKPRKPTPQRPEVSADTLLLAQVCAQPLRREQEVLLEELVHDTPDSSPEKPDVLFRLAELYAQQGRFWWFRAVGATMPGGSVPSCPRLKPRRR